MTRYIHYSHFAVTILLVLVLAPSVRAQDVQMHPDPTARLDDRFAWAQREGNDQGHSYWIGYYVERLMGRHSFVMSGYDSSWRGRPSLHEVIYGRPAPDEGPGVADDDDLRQAAQRALDQDYDDDDTPVRKRIAILFRIDADGALRDVRVSNMSVPVDLDGRPLLWLGPANNKESIGLLDAQYRQAHNVDAKEHLVTAVGIHDDPVLATPVLSRILKSDEPDDVREKTAFWLGQGDDPGALKLLVATARDDRSMDVREQAVFGISQMNLPAATDALIDLARNEGDRDVRKKAVFWLSQQASDRVAETLKDVAFARGDTEVQEQAVFALSQLDDRDGVPLLIEIARTHDNPDVRKKAIFWLGQSSDPRALDALVALAKGR